MRNADSAQSANHWASAGAGARAAFRPRIHRLFGAVSNRVSLLVGSPWAFLLACLLVVLWGLTGPISTTRTAGSS